jgi:hypothetical protein
MFVANGDVKRAFDDPNPAQARPLFMILGLAASHFGWPPGLLAAFRDENDPLHGLMNFSRDPWPTLLSVAQGDVAS